MSTLDVFDIFSRDYARERFETMSLRDWLLAARDDKMLYASPAERLVAAIGEPELIDTAQDSRLGRIFFNRTIKIYRAFDGFYGMEDTIERIVGYFKHAAQGLEERRQILYLLGPVGGGKSSLAERLKDLMEKYPIYVLKAGDQISPVFESPLGLCRSNQGLLEFVEMFKAPIKVLHPLLTATQEGNYIGTETLGPIPFNGIILAHSNEAEWQVFKSNRNNEAFLDRICVITVPYCLRVTEETRIYKKLITQSELAGA